MLTHGSPHSPRSPTSARSATVEPPSPHHGNDHGTSNVSPPVSPLLNSIGDSNERTGDISSTSIISGSGDNASDTPHGVDSPISSPIAVVRSPEEHGDEGGDEGNGRHSSDRQRSSSGRSRLNSADSDSPPRVALTYL